MYFLLPEEPVDKDPPPVNTAVGVGVTVLETGKSVQTMVEEGAGGLGV
jgi:hypothetical protein